MWYNICEETNTTCKTCGIYACNTLYNRGFSRKDADASQEMEGAMGMGFNDLHYGTLRFLEKVCVTNDGTCFTFADQTHVNAVGY